MNTSIVLALVVSVSASTALADTQLTFRGPFQALEAGDTTFVTLEARHAGGELTHLLRELYTNGDAAYSVSLVTPTRGCPVNPRFSLSKFSRNVLSQFGVRASAECAAFLGDVLQNGLQWRIVDGDQALLITVQPTR
jgi:hypothetical protein